MKKNKRIILLIVFGIASLVIQIPSSNAAIWYFTATHDFDSNQDFLLAFDDLDNDNSVFANDIIPGSFTGVAYLTRTYDIVGYIPQLTVNGLTLNYTNTNHINNWYFKDSDGYGLISSNTAWEYEATSVPIPGAVWLLGSGLGIVGLRRKLKK